MIKRYAVWDTKHEAFAAAVIALSTSGQTEIRAVLAFDTKERAELAIKSPIYNNDPRYQVRMIATSNID